MRTQIDGGHLMIDTLHLPGFGTAGSGCAVWRSGEVGKQIELQQLGGRRAENVGPVTRTLERAHRGGHHPLQRPGIPYTPPHQTHHIQLSKNKEVHIFQE